MKFGEKSRKFWRIPVSFREIHGVPGNSESSKEFQRIAKKNSPGHRPEACQITQPIFSIEYLLTIVRPWEPQDLIDHTSSMRQTTSYDVKALITLHTRSRYGFGTDFELILERFRANFFFSESMPILTSESLRQRGRL